MSITEVPSAGHDAAAGNVDFHLEVEIIPVSNVDRSKQFYQRLGWRLDADDAPLDGLRIVQFTPPGSAASITFGQGLTTAAPGSAEAALIVSDIEAAHDELAGRGIDTSQIWHGPPFPPRGTATWPRPPAHQLRVVLLFHRSRRQYVASPGGHHPAARPDRCHRDGIRLHRRPGQCAAAGRSRSRQAPERHRTAAPVPPVRPRRGLAGLVRRPHGDRAGRDRPASVTEPALAPPPRARRPGQRDRRPTPATPCALPPTRRSTQSTGSPTTGSSARRNAQT
jgi:catechol 2,3-dioxygenase-like lactoylglutathione lyase family enzyme